MVGTASGKVRHVNGGQSNYMASKSMQAYFYLCNLLQKSICILREVSSVDVEDPRETGTINFIMELSRS